MDRKMIFVTGSHHSGKSRLGHMLATYEDCLYSYHTLSPQKYFSESTGYLNDPCEETILILKQAIVKSSELLSGGISKHDGKPWLREDNLIKYNYQQFSNDFCYSINREIDVGNFYLLWDKYLQLSRESGSSSKFTVFEIEGVEGTDYVKLIKKKIPTAIFLSVIRKPINQIRSCKADILVRGPNNNKYAGAQSSENNLYFKYIESLIDQYQWANNSNNDHLIKQIKFENLINVTEVMCLEISKIIYDNKNNQLIDHLIEISKPNAEFKNKYVSFKRNAQSFYALYRQKHLPVEVRKDNFDSYTYQFERIFYRSINDLKNYDLKNGYKYFFTNFIKNLFVYPLLVICSLLFGFKEIRTWLPFRNRITLRRNSFIIVSKLGLKVLSHKFTLIFNVK